MFLLNLPLELLIEITSLILDGHPCPSDLLCVNKLFCKLGQLILHSHLNFRSIDQLTLFASNTSPLACLPRSIVVTLAGGLADFDVFRYLSTTLRRCRTSVPGTDFTEPNAQLPLELMSLCLHSHSRNPNQQYIYEALAQAR